MAIFLTIQAAFIFILINMDHMGRAAFCRLIHAILQIFESHTVIQLTCDP